MHDTSAGTARPTWAWDLRPFELLRDGFALVQPHYTLFLLFVLTAALLMLGFSRLPWVGALGLVAVGATANSGITWFLLQVCRGQAVSWRTFFEPMSTKPGAIVALHSLGGLLIGLGCIAVLPGLYLAVAFALSLPLLLTQDLTPWQALVRSRRLVHQQLGDFIMLSLTLVVINAMAALLFGLPLLWALPATCGANTLVVAQVLGWRERPACAG